MSENVHITTFSDKRVDAAKITKSGNALNNAEKSFTSLPGAEPQLPGAIRDAKLCKLAAEVMKPRSLANSEDDHPTALTNSQELTTADKASPDLDQAKRIAWIMHNGLQKFKEQHPLPTHKNVQQYNSLAEIHNKHIAKYADQFPGQLPGRLDLIPLRELPKGERPDRIAPLLKLKGGISYWYNESSGEYSGRIIALRDPKGRVHVFNRGESNRDIASFTSRCIDDYRTQHADQWAQDLRGQGYRVSSQQLEYYKNQYNEGKALTTRQVKELREGNSVHGWECTQLTDLVLQKSFYYTDQGTEITALNLSGYQSYTREEHDKSFPPPRYHTIAGPTPIFNCHGHFINRAAWLVTGKPGESGESQIRKILDDNGYKRVSPENAQINDIVAYYRKGESISHTAIVVRVDGKIIVESKMGSFGLTRHDMNDEDGQPIIFHTERQGGHLLRTTRPMNPLS